MVCVGGGVGGVAAAAAAAATNILQVHINWLWEAGSRGNSIIRKVDEDRKLDGSHLRQKTAPPRQPSGGEASLCIINELPSARRSAAVFNAGSQNKPVSWSQSGALGRCLRALPLEEQGRGGNYGLVQPWRADYLLKTFDASHEAI